jgi:tetratricopeptide (TPR) repeat protein
MHAVEFYVSARLLEHHQLGLVRVAQAPDEIPFEQQVKQLRDRLQEGVVCFNAGQYAQASSAFEGALEIDPQNKYARLFLLKIRRLGEDREPTPKIALDTVPVLKRSLEDLSRMTLEPQEGFVLSRINGEWDVRSILKICPLSETEVLLIFKRLQDEGLIELT